MTIQQIPESNCNFYMKDCVHLWLSLLLMALLTLINDQSLLHHGMQKATY